MVEIIRRAFMIVLVAGAAAACQKARDNDLPAAYIEDIDRICNQERLSGAVNQPESERAMASAYWLERNLKTPEARKFSASVVPLAPPAKAQRLAAEAARAGLLSCPTADSWRGPGPAPAP